MNDRNDEWKTIYKATKVRLEKGLKSYADYLDTKLVTSEDCDILCIKAESRMLLEPWKLWNVETMKQTENAEHVEMMEQKFPIVYAQKMELMLIRNAATMYS